MKLPEQIRQIVQERAHGCGEYCFSQEEFDNKSFSIVHIIPISLGGCSEVENLAYCCQGCNNFKYTKTEGRDPETATIVALFNPRSDDWKDHFKWNDNFTVILGITMIGRATVNTLQLNRLQLINQRIIYSKASVHPPAHLLS
jgi:hypothetical protein